MAPIEEDIVSGIYWVLSGLALRLVQIIVSWAINHVHLPRYLGMIAAIALILTYFYVDILFLRALILNFKKYEYLNFNYERDNVSCWSWFAQKIVQFGFYVSILPFAFAFIFPALLMILYSMTFSAFLIIGFVWKIFTVVGKCNAALGRECFGAVRRQILKYLLFILAVVLFYLTCLVDYIYFESGGGMGYVYLVINLLSVVVSFIAWYSTRHWVPYGRIYTGDSKTIGFIDFDIFKDLGSIPRCPDLQLTCTLDSIDRDQALLVFVSHCWMNPNIDASLAHPDNESNDKFALCVNGIEWIRRNLAPKMKNCYVWIDYSCINQTDRKMLPKELKRYNKIIECCDLIFTPVVSEIHMTETPLWDGQGPTAYLNRAWCRVEMMFAANIPVLENKLEYMKRSTLFEGSLSDSCQLNRRPHYLYTTREYVNNTAPVVVAPLQDLSYEKLKPEDGNITDPRDVEHIRVLTSSIEVYMELNRREGDYNGQVSLLGARQGVGIMRYINGDKYTGEWRNDKRHGQGTMEYLDGSELLGVYCNDQLTDGSVPYSSRDCLTLKEIAVGVYSVFLKSLLTKKATMVDFYRRWCVRARNEENIADGASPAS